MSENINENEAQLLEAMSVAEDKTEYKATAGTPLATIQNIASKEEIIEAIRSVYDPELPVNVYDMGLIYDIKQESDGNVFIDMTLTAPGCPVAGILPAQVAAAVSLLEGGGVVEVKIIWEPAWTIDRMTDEAKAMLDLF